MKKYFVSFTYGRTNAAGDQVGDQKLLTYEIIELNLEAMKIGGKNALSAVLFNAGYNNVNILHMNPL